MSATQLAPPPTGVPTAPSPAGVGGRPHAHTPKSRLDAWLEIQSINLARHARSLRRFAKGEFGTGPAAPYEAHLDAVNAFVDRFRNRVIERSRWFDAAVLAAKRDPSPRHLALVLRRKDEVGRSVLFVEGIWDFYFDLFVQRQSSLAPRLQAIDRLARSCYEDLYQGLSTPIPTPRLLPFSYASSGFSPLTYRRGVPLARLRHNPNLFPLIVIPQHRLDNAWALSSVLHEVAHNIQSDLGLWDELPVRVHDRLAREPGISAGVARWWAQTNREVMADLLALLLGGPALVESLMDVVGRSPQATVHFDAGAPHPTPYLRVPISLALLRRLGFASKADDLDAVWRRLYPSGGAGTIPNEISRTFPKAVSLVVDTMVFEPYPQLGNRSLAQVVTLGADQMRLIEQAAATLAGGADTTSVPPRYMVSAARWALDHRLASPQAITDTFYAALGRQ